MLLSWDAVMSLLQTHESALAGALGAELGTLDAPET